jgi:hypothetical protein
MFLGALGVCLSAEECELFFILNSHRLNVAASGLKYQFS